MKQSRKRGDLILIFTLLVLGTAGFLLIQYLSSRDKPSEVTIKTSQQVLHLPLKDTLLTLEGPVGETKLIIAGGKVWITESSCRQKLCVKQGRISRPGQSIVCLPNRIVISIEGKTKIDATTY